MKNLVFLKFYTNKESDINILILFQNNLGSLYIYHDLHRYFISRLNYVHIGYS